MRLDTNSIHIYSRGILLWEERKDAHSPHRTPRGLRRTVPLPAAVPGGRGRVRALPSRSMHSLVLSQRSETPPHKLSSDIQELVRSWARISTGACWGQSRPVVVWLGPGHPPKRRPLKATLHVLPRQRYGANLDKGPNVEGPGAAACRVPQTGQCCPPFSSVSSRQALPEARVHLRKCLSLAGLDMTLQHRLGRT